MQTHYPRHCERSEAIHAHFRYRSRDCFASLTMTESNTHTGSAIEYFTWLNAKLDSIEAMPSSRVSLFFKNAS
jgi:hypothetical protein